MSKKPGKIKTFDEIMAEMKAVAFLPECQYQRQERNVTMCHNVHSVHVNQPCSKRCIYEPKVKSEDLHQCPCEPACTCAMEEPCLGCETYGEWLRKAGDND